LTATIDAKDHITFGHSQRVAKYATAIAEAAGSKSSEIEIIRLAALLHDIGKIGVPENVLTKTSRLTTEEYETMKKHVDLSITIIKYLPSFSKVIPSVIGHHERWDGKGYPRKIAGEAIPFGARCIALADAFDAITSDRQYKINMDTDYAINEIKRNSGTQFDPELTEIFVELIASGKLIVEPTRTNIYTIDSFLERPVN
jgi:putative nucleotidyltransferase with HDIG domain